MVKTELRLTLFGRKRWQPVNIVMQRITNALRAGGNHTGEFTTPDRRFRALWTLVETDPRKSSPSPLRERAGERVNRRKK